MGEFGINIIPEHRETMWGPVPLPPLPPGVDNVCEVADHRYGHPTLAELLYAHVWVNLANDWGPVPFPPMPSCIGRNTQV